jgi:TonB family protein
MILRPFLFCLLLPASLLVAETKEEADARVKAERDANRSWIEVSDIKYPLYLFEEEVDPKHRAKVAIPKKAKRQGRGGMVLLGTIVDRHGKIINMTVAMTNAEEDIQEAAMRAVGSWTFPIIKDADQRPIDYAVMVPILVDPTPHYGPKDTPSTITP